MTCYLFHVHPADLIDEGIDAVLDRLRGEIGVDGIVVDAVASARLALRPRVTDAPKIALYEAAAWFQPDPKHYSGTRLRPNTARSIKSRDELARICDAAAARGLVVRARVDAFDNATLVERHSTIACVDVFGRAHDSRICPSQPDVREYLGAILENLSTKYALADIELVDADYGAGLYAAANLRAGVPLDELTLSMLGWCYCASCRQRALDMGIDVDAVRSTLAAHLASAFELEATGRSDFARWIDASAVLNGYSQTRIEAITSLLKNVRRRSSKPLHLHTARDAAQSGLKVGDVREFCDGFVLPVEDAQIADLSTRHGHILDLAGGPGAVALPLVCHPPRTADAQALVSRVPEATRAGCGAVIFLDYGLAPTPCLDWVRQAVRFARREQA